MEIKEIPVELKKYWRIREYDGKENIWVDFQNFLIDMISDYCKSSNADPRIIAMYDLYCFSCGNGRHLHDVPLC